MTDAVSPEPVGEPQNEGLEFVMPFVVCKSNGGPYDDDAFAAGWQAGGIEASLQLAEKLCVTSLQWPMFRTGLAPQVDLIAMRFGFTAQVEPSAEYPEWGVLTLTREGRHG